MGNPENESTFRDSYIMDIAQLLSEKPLTVHKTDTWKSAVIEKGKEPAHISQQMEFLGSVLLPEGIKITSFTFCGLNRLVGHDRQGQYICIDTLTGNINWKSQEKGKYNHPLYVAQEGLLYSSYNKRKVVAIDPETGKHVWSATVPIFYSSFITYGDLLVFHSNDTVYALNRTTRKTEWQTKLPDHIEMSGLLIWKGYVLAHCMTRRTKTVFHLIEASSGKISNSIDAHVAMEDSRQAIATEEYLWFCTKKGTIGVLDSVSETVREVESTLFSENGKPAAVQVKGFQYRGEHLYFRPDTLYYDTEKNGIYTCDRDLNIQQVSSSATGLEEEGCQQGEYIYHLNSRHYCVTRFSLTGLKNEQLRFPHFNGHDVLVCMALLPSNTLIVVQQGGVENDNRQILHAIR